jgi:hypothetical protein
VSSSPDAGLAVAGRQGGESQTAMTLLGLLHHLWERSALNRWPGRRGRRGWRECVRPLAEAIDETRTDQAALSQILHLIRPYGPGAAANDIGVRALCRSVGLLRQAHPARDVARRYQGSDTG